MGDGERLVASSPARLMNSPSGLTVKHYVKMRLCWEGCLGRLWAPPQMDCLRSQLFSEAPRVSEDNSDAVLLPDWVPGREASPDSSPRLTEQAPSLRV